MSNFYEMNEIGKVGETAVSSYLSSLGYIVEDVSGNPAYQKKDIDFMISGAELSAPLFIEVKTDLQISKTGNLLFEDVFFRDWGESAGWLHYCEADYLVFFDVETRKTYWLDVAVMRELVPRRSDYRIYSSPGDNCNKGCYLLDIGGAISIKNPKRLVVGRVKI